MDLWVAVDLRRGGQQHARVDALRQTEHVERSLGGGLDRFDRVVPAWVLFLF